MSKCLHRLLFTLLCWKVLSCSLPVYGFCVPVTPLSYQVFSQSNLPLLFVSPALKLSSTTLRLSAKPVQANSATRLQSLLKNAKLDYTRGNYPASLRGALAAEKMASSQKNDTAVADAGNIIALVYMAQGQYQPVLPYLQKAAAINKKAGHLRHLVTNLINLCLYYSDQHQPQKAIRYADSSLNLSATIGAANLEAMSANHLGKNYLEIGDHKKAAQSFRRVLDNKRYQDDWENSFANTGLARLYLKERNYVKAIQYGEEGFRLARKTATKWDAQQAAQILSQAYQQAHNYERAFYYLAEYKCYSDSLFNEKKEAEINFLLLKKKEAENRDLLHNNLLSKQQQKNTQMVVLMVSILAVGLLVLVTYWYKKFSGSHRSNTALQQQFNEIERKSILISEQNLNLNQQNYTKDQLFSIIGHDLRSPFSSILNTLELFQSDDLEANEIREIASKFQEQVSVTAKMLDNLLLWGSSQLGGMKQHREVFNLAQVTGEVIDVYREVAARKHINLQFQPLADVTIWADVNQIKVIIQNILANAIKFTPNGGEVNVSFTTSGEHVELIIRDNGLGMSPEILHQLLRYGGKRVSTYGTANEKGIGLGLLLVKDFAEQNEAVVQAQSQENEGTTFFISFKRHQPSR
jgi:signal transduction histidine kinase